MVDIVTRAGKGSPLTFAEADGNLLAIKAVLDAIGALMPLSATAKPSIATDGTPQVGETMTGQHGTYVNGVVTGRAWLLGGSAISGQIGVTYVPTATGSLVYREIVTGPAGVIPCDSDPVMVAAATVPQLTLGGPLAFSTSATAGTLVATISGVPSGVAPTLTPGDGRLVIAGDATSGWKVVVGMTAASAGTIALTVAAAQATSASATVTVSAPGAVAISAPDAIQPQATQRWYLATATAPVTWSISPGFTITAIDSQRAVWSANVDNVGTAGGSTNLTRTPTITGTPVGGGTPATAAPTLTLTPIVATGVLSPNFTSDFSGAAGTPLETVSGWAASGVPTGSPLLDGAGKVVGRGGGDGTSALIYRDPGVDPAGSVVTITVEQPDSSGKTGAVCVAAGYNSTRTRGLVSWYGTSAGGLSLVNGDFLVYDGSNQNDKPIGIVPWRGDGSADIQFAFTADGKTGTVSIIGLNSAGTSTFDLTGKPLGRLFGFLNAGSNSDMLGNGAKVRRVSFLKPAVIIGAISVPAFATSNSVVAGIPWSGTKPAGWQHQWVSAPTDPDGPNWLTGEATINDDGTSSYVATAATASFTYLRVRPYNDTVVTATAANRTKMLANVLPFTLGYNLHVGAPILSNNILTDYGKTQAVAGGRITMPGQDITGDQTITVLPAGGTITGTSDPTVQVLSAPASGIWRIRVTGDIPSGGRSISYSGPSLTSANVTRDGITSKYAPEALAGWEGDVLRDLDQTAQNVVFLTDDFPVKTSDMKNYVDQYSNTYDYPYDDRVGFAAAVRPNGNPLKYYWPVIRIDMKDAELTTLATYWRDTLDPSTKITPQLNNEDPWNDSFTGVVRGWIDAVRYGYGSPSSTPTTPGPQVTVTVPVNRGGPGNNTDSPQVSSGGLVFYNVYGIGNAIWQAKQDVPAGSNINENSYFTQRKDIDLIRSERIWFMARYVQMLDIIKGVFGQARYDAQIMPLRMGQAGGSFAGFMAIERQYPAYFSRLKMGGFAWYFGHVDNYTGPRTPAGILADLNAKAPSIRQGITQMVADCLDMGLIPAMYEGITHPDFGLYGGPTADSAAYKNAWDSLFASTDGQNFIAAQVAWMRANVPGLVVGYDFVGGPPWSIKNYWSDKTNPRYLGVKTGLS